MMTDFLFVEEVNDVFSTSILLTVEELGIYSIGQCKIDTGCAHTNIPIQRLNVSAKKARQLKQDAIDKKISFHPTYGVSDTEENKSRDRKLIKQNRLMDVPSLRFQYEADSLILGNQVLSYKTIGINFDRTGNILIGLDILKQFQIVIDTSVVTGKHTLIGCLKNQEDKDEFYKALKRHFKL